MKHRSQRGLPRDAHALHHAVSEVGVQSHAGRERNRIARERAHQQRAQRGGDTGGGRDRGQRHPGVFQNRGIHEDDVRHRDKGCEARQNLGFPVRVQPGKLKIVLQRAFDLPEQSGPPACDNRRWHCVRIRVSETEINGIGRVGPRRGPSPTVIRDDSSTRASIGGRKIASRRKHCQARCLPIYWSCRAVRLVGGATRLVVSPSTQSSPSHIRLERCMRPFLISRRIVLGPDLGRRADVARRADAAPLCSPRSTCAGTGGGELARDARQVLRNLP